MINRAAYFTTKKLATLTLVIVAALITLLFLASWILARGVEENTEQPSPDTTIQPINPYGTGGSSGAGTGTSNDPGTATPSPAGGVDTNQVPAGGTSPGY
jgi:hypothetical protein